MEHQNQFLCTNALSMDHLKQHFESRNIIPTSNTLPAMRAQLKAFIVLRREEQLQEQALHPRTRSSGKAFPFPVKTGSPGGAFGSHRTVEKYPEHPGLAAAEASMSSSKSHGYGIKVSRFKLIW